MALSIQTVAKRRPKLRTSDNRWVDDSVAAILRQNCVKKSGHTYSDTQDRVREKACRWCSACPRKCVVCSISHMLASNGGSSKLSPRAGILWAMTSFFPIRLRYDGRRF